MCFELSCNPHPEPPGEAAAKKFADELGPVIRFVRKAKLAASELRNVTCVPCPED